MNPPDTRGTVVESPVPATPPRRPRFRRTPTLIVAGVVAAVVLLLGVAVLSGSEGGPAFEDDFSSQEAAWKAVGNGSGAYEAATYHLRGVSVEGGGAVFAFPTKGARAYPTTADDITVDVDARVVARTGGDAGYGLACRLGPSAGYSFILGQDHVAIGKYSDVEPYYVDLVEKGWEVDRNVSTRFQATCTGDAGQQHLVFQLNGSVVLETTDTQSPLAAGGAGLVVGNGPGDNTLDVAFDDFVVNEG